MNHLLDLKDTLSGEFHLPGGFHLQGLSARQDAST
jgi:hypothetical protein